MPETQTTTLIPHLCCRNASDAVEFYQRAFGAEPIGVVKTPGGKLMHAALKVDGAVFYLTDEWPEHGALSPLVLKGTPVTLHLQVPDCDALFQRAVEAGCEVRMPLEEMFWGDRYGIVVDPYGHKWSIATTIRQVSPEEVQQAIAVMGNS
jgi:PhnB protein